MHRLFTQCQFSLEKRMSVSPTVTRHPFQQSKNTGHTAFWLLWSFMCSLGKIFNLHSFCFFQDMGLGGHILFQQRNREYWALWWTTYNQWKGLVSTKCVAFDASLMYTLCSHCTLSGRFVFQAGIKLLDSSDHPASALWEAPVIGMPCTPGSSLHS